MSSPPSEPVWGARLDAASQVAFSVREVWPLLEPQGAAPAWVDQAAWSHEQWRADAARVARDRHDMQAHARRVLLQCHADVGNATPQQLATRAARLFGALADVFLAVGAHGPELRASLLTRARPHLTADQHAFLARHLAGGLHRLAPLPAGAHSVLEAGVVGRVDLVAIRQEPVQPKAALERAIDLVDQGDTEAAQAVLEEALLADPADIEVAEELGQMYRLNGSQVAAATMVQRLRERGLPAPTGWQAP